MKTLTREFVETVTRNAPNYLGNFKCYLLGTLVFSAWSQNMELGSELRRRWLYAGGGGVSGSEELFEGYTCGREQLVTDDALLVLLEQELERLTEIAEEREVAARRRQEYADARREGLRRITG